MHAVLSFVQFHYMTGYGGSFETEALKGALPKVQNTPQMSVVVRNVQRAESVRSQMPVWAHRRTAVGHVVHDPARSEPTNVSEAAGVLGRATNSGECHRWLYRIRPTVQHMPMARIDNGSIV